MRIVIVLIISFSVYARAHAQGVQSCYQGPLPASLVTLKKSGLSDFNAYKALENICNDLKSETFKNKVSLKGKVLHAVLDVSFSVAQDIPSVISTMLGSDQNVKDYKAKLASIGQIQNRFARIRKVYELSVSAQGPYDDGGGPIFSTPGRTINKTKDNKAWGQCRNFAQLLEWSLLQVNRSPFLPEDMKKWGALDEDSFMPKFVHDEDAGHAWVEVSLPVGIGGKQEFHKINLDTTWYKDYTPLYPRRGVVDAGKRNQLLAECSKVLSCVQKFAFKSIGEVLSNPAPSGQHCD
ncbi:MAG TPA: hypothetical protein VNJ08_03105 [Bacteriovoracaceae bacterium]|nr:hypothetical protein [Bacteriovoracaceae bacterium]